MLDLKMVYRKNTLYVNLLGSINQDSLLTIKKRIFTVVSEYDIKKVIFCTKGLNNSDLNLINSFKSEFKKKFNNSLLII